MTSIEHLETLAVISKLQSTLEAARLRKNAFSRKRKMSFANALSFLLDMRKTFIPPAPFSPQTGGKNPLFQRLFTT